MKKEIKVEYLLKIGRKSWQAQDRLSNIIGELEDIFSDGMIVDELILDALGIPEDNTIKYGDIMDKMPDDYYCRDMAFEKLCDYYDNKKAKEADCIKEILKLKN